jgi:uncharacterized RDD family membrane protein YckC
MPMSTTTWGSRTTALELPEEVDLQLEVANVGSRTLAILIDLGICAVLLVGVYVLTTIFAREAAPDWINRVGSNVMTIVLLITVFGAQWVYFNVFEWVWNGQTPGKRLMHLRVIKVDGAPVSWIDVLLRNLSRPVDTFGPMGLLGLLMIFVSRRAQRLGDLMARTLVIHETPIDWSIFDETGDAAAPSSNAPSIQLTAAQWELLHRFLNRREELPPEVRARVADSVYRHLKPLARGTDLELSTLAAEEWLVEFARRT